MLYGAAYNVYVRAVRLALAEKGVQYQLIEIDLGAEEGAPANYLHHANFMRIPAFEHAGERLYEASAITRYVDEAFDGPALKPVSPVERWRMRWWMRFFDAYFGPSLSMIGWSVFVGPSARGRDPAELRAAIDRIPLESRRIAWRKALFNEFTEAELAESRRRVVFATHVLERHLGAHTWIAGDTYSLGDINGFNLGYALPLSQPTECNDEKTPHIMEWLRRIYERPAVRQTWAKGRTALAGRIALLERTPAPAPGGRP